MTPAHATCLDSPTAQPTRAPSGRSFARALLARLRGLFPARPPLLDLEMLSDARLRDLGFFDGRSGKLPRGD